MIILLWLACAPEPGPVSAPAPAPALVTNTSTTEVDDHLDCPEAPETVCPEEHLSTSTPTDGDTCGDHGDCAPGTFCGEGQCRPLAGSMGTVCVVRSTNVGTKCEGQPPSVAVVHLLDLVQAISGDGDVCLVDFNPEDGCFAFDLGLVADYGLGFEGSLFATQERVIESINQGCTPIASFRTPARVDTISVWYP